MLDGLEFLKLAECTAPGQYIDESCGAGFYGVGRPELPRSDLIAGTSQSPALYGVLCNVLATHVSGNFASNKDQSCNECLVSAY